MSTSALGRDSELKYAYAYPLLEKKNQVWKGFPKEKFSV